MKFLSLLFFLFIFSTIATFSQVTINVPGDYATIQEGIDAGSNGDIVLVADGTYLENINFKGKAITVASHFLNDGNEAHIENTIIDGSQPTYPDTGTVVSFINGEDTSSVLCGFTITGGTGTLGTPTIRAGGGISVYLSGAKICNNIIEYNSVNHTDRASGGGIFVSSNTDIAIIKNNIIRNNSVTGTYPYGGGISLSNSGLSYILSNQIIDNEAIGTNASGGGIDAFYINGEAIINNNYIKGNDAQLNGYGGGGIDLYNWEAPITISNNLIVDNNARWGGGVLVDYNLESSSKTTTLTESFEYLEELPVLVNNTIINNFGTVVGGIYGRGSTPDVTNNIVWGNTYNSGGQIGGTATVTYSDVEGGYPGTGNIDCNPEFLDTTYFLLSDFSCCVDTGNPDPMYNDVEDPNNPGFALYPAMGNLRNDMGTFGGPNSTWSSVLSDTIHVPGDYLTIQAAIDAAINGNVVLVADGTYLENINYKGKAITVASHFLIDGDTSHISNTIIDGSQPSHPDSGSVVFFESGEDTTSILCGFTITGGTGTIIVPNLARGGGGVLCNLSGAKICHNRITNNVVNYDFESLGGGISSGPPGSDAMIIVENNWIQSNQTIGANFEMHASYGAGLALHSYCRVTGNRILDNVASSELNQAFGGGFVSLESDFVLFINNNVIGNKALTNATDDLGAGGGIYFIRDSIAYIRVMNNIIAYNEVKSEYFAIAAGMGFEKTGNYGGDVLFANNIVYGNYCTGMGESRGGGLSLRISTVKVFNNTITTNSSDYGGGLSCYDSESSVIMNSIFWGDISNSEISIHGTALAPEIVYSDIQGGLTGEGNINANPLFVDASNGDFRLLDNVSPCLQTGIDSIDVGGTTYHSPPFCIYGVARPSPAGTMPDMGACENPILVGVDNDLALIPDEYSLDQNYPNPFNPSTTIKYEIKELTQVELKVFDILGRELISLVNKEQPAGSYEIVFDAAHLTSGIYFYRLQAGEFIQTKKMILLK